jgi:hypothetical protein
MGKRRFSDDAIRGVIDDLRTTTMTQKEYAKTLGVSDRTLRSWKKRLFPRCVPPEQVHALFVEFVHRAQALLRAAAQSAPSEPPSAMSDKSADVPIARTLASLGHPLNEQPCNSAPQKKRSFWEDPDVDWQDD